MDYLGSITYKQVKDIFPVKKLARKMSSGYLKWMLRSYRTRYLSVLKDLMCMKRTGCLYVVPILNLDSLITRASHLGGHASLEGQQAWDTMANRPVSFVNMNMGAFADITRW